MKQSDGGTFGEWREEVADALYTETDMSLSELSKTYTKLLRLQMFNVYTKDVDSAEFVNSIIDQMNGDDFFGVSMLSEVFEKGLTF